MKRIRLNSSSKNPSNHGLKGNQANPVAGSIRVWLVCDRCIAIHWIVFSVIRFVIWFDFICFKLKLSIKWLRWLFKSHSYIESFSLKPPRNNAAHSVDPRVTLVQTNFSPFKDQKRLIHENLWRRQLFVLIQFQELLSPDGSTFKLAIQSCYSNSRSKQAIQTCDLTGKFQSKSQDFVCS